MTHRRFFPQLIVGFIASAISATGLLATGSLPAAQASTDNPSLVSGPIMGWSSWYATRCNVTEKDVRAAADTLVSSGMAAQGYTYVDVDDCWMTTKRDSDGNLVVNSSRFPSGMKAVADYVHSKGLKFGIYEDIGTATCDGYPGSYQHYAQDAKLFAGWGVDLVKIDSCHMPYDDFPNTTPPALHEQLQREYISEVRKVSPKMIYNVCISRAEQMSPWTWAPSVSEMSRITWDLSGSWYSQLRNIDAAVAQAPYQKTGYYNDMDLMLAGVSGMMTETEQRTQMALWSMMSSPLIASNDMSSMSDTTKSILMNQDLIDIDQDTSGQPARRVSHSKTTDIFVKQLSAGDRAVTMLNRTDAAQTIRIELTRQVGLPVTWKYQVRDLNSHQTWVQASPYIVRTVPAHGQFTFRVQPATSSNSGSVEASLSTASLTSQSMLSATSDYAHVFTNTTSGGTTLTMNNYRYAKGYWANSNAVMSWWLGKHCRRLTVGLGIDDSARSEGSVTFTMYGDGHLLYQSGKMTRSSATKTVAVDLSGVSTFTIHVNDAHDGIRYDNADIVSPTVTCNN